jgi:CHASE3 domain sensor protein
MRPTKLGTRLMLAHVPALLVAFLVAFLVQRALDATRQTQELKGRSSDAISSSHEFLRAVVDAETAQRGFVITGSESFLGPYNEAAPLADTASDAMLAAVEDEPRQVQRVKHARALFERWLVEHARPTVAARRVDEEAAHARVASGKGKVLVDQIRAVVDQFVRDEATRHDARAARSRAAANTATWMALVGPLVAFAATLVLSLAAALQVSRALDRLVAVAARLATGELGQRAAVERSDEIGELAKAFNAMAEKLDARAVQNARLGDLGQMLQASIDTEEACQVFARLAPALLQAPAGSVAIFNASRNLLSPLSHWGTAGAEAEPFVPDDCWALRRGKSHCPRGEGDFRCAHNLLPAGPQHRHPTS